MVKLPKITESQNTGERAANFLSSVFTKFCIVIPVPQARDIGIDFICELKQGGYPTGKLFNIQCKGKEAIEIEGDVIRVTISVTTINYWLIQRNPTLLIVVDLEEGSFYWTFPKEFFL
jgi:hypothetical protein